LLFLCSALFLLPRSGYAQLTPGATWKKRVYRVIDMTEKETAKANALTDVRTDSTLFQMFDDAINSGTIPVYANSDLYFNSKLDLKTLPDLICPWYKTDTVVVFDPITGDEIHMKRRTPFFDQMNEYGILEECSFNTSTGKTDMQVVGIGPLNITHGDVLPPCDKPMLFWMKYQDALPIIRRYEQYNPESTIAGKIWGSYFQSDEKPREIE
jgi:hypothetical protein